MENMEADYFQTPPWGRCRPGEVGEMVARLQNHRRSARMQRGVAMAMVLLLAVFTSYFNVLVIVHAADPGSGQFACNDIWKLRGKFLAGELLEEQDETIRRHLDACPTCRKRVWLYSRARRQEPVSNLMDSAPTDSTRSGTRFVVHPRRSADPAHGD